MSFNPLHPFPQALGRALQRTAAPPLEEVLAPSHESRSTPQTEPMVGLPTLLDAARPIAFNINFARITGDAKAALFLSQLVYWTRRGADVLANDGWIFKTRDQWEIETGLTRHEQLGVQTMLLEQGLIEAQKIGAPARNCYRVMAPMLGSRLAQLVKAEPVQWSLLDIQQADNAKVKALLGRQFAFYRMLTELAHSTTCAIYLSRSIAVDQRVADVKGDAPKAFLPWDQQWFRLAVDSMQLDTGLTGAQQRDAKHKLCQIGVLDEGMLTHPRKQIYLRINAPVLVERLKQVLLKPEVSDSFYNCHPGEQLSNVSELLSDTSGQWSPGRHWPTSSAPKQVDGLVDTPGCENRTTSHPVLQGSVVRFSPISDPVFTQVSSGFSKRDGLFLAVSPNTYARTTRAPRLQGDYKETTTTTTPPEHNASSEAGCRPVERSASVVVVDARLTKTELPVASMQAVSGEVVADWAWPETLDEAMRQSAARMLAPLAKTGRLDEVQCLLDEWAGCLANQTIRSPLGYLRQLLRTHQQTPGGLVWEQALVVQQQRKDRLIRAERLAELELRQRGLMGPADAADAADRAVVGAQASSQAVGLSETAKAALEKLRKSIPKMKGGDRHASPVEQPIQTTTKE